MTLELPRHSRRPPRTVLVAGAGWGKTTAVEVAVGTVARPATDLLARVLDGALPAADGHVVVDDLHVLPVEEQCRLLAALERQSPDLPITVASRRPVGPAVLACLRGPVHERGPDDLGLSPEQVAAVLRDEHGVTATDQAARVHDLTAGWPSLVHAAGALLRRGSTVLLAELAAPGSTSAAWVHREVLADLPREVRRALGLVTDLGPMGVDLLTHLDPGADATGVVEWLRRTGLLVPHPGRPHGPAPWRLVPVVAAVAAGLVADTATGDGAQARHRAAARWYESHGLPLAAATSWVRAGDTGRADAVLVGRERAILGAGGARDVVALLGGRQATDLRPELRRVLGNACRMAGDPGAARRALAPMVVDAMRTGRLDAGLAWRAAMVDYVRGDHRAALVTLDAASPPITGSAGPSQHADHDLVGPVEAVEAVEPVELVELLACRANVLSMLGREREALAVAARAVHLAELAGDDGSRAAAHLAAANAAVGERADTHLAQALVAAQRAGDAVQSARVLVNQAHRLLAAARFADAAQEARAAVRACEQGCPPGLLVTALDNLGQALLNLGRFEEAAVQFDRLLACARQAGLERRAYGLTGLAECWAQLGRREESRAAFEEALQVAQEADDAQALARAGAGLARLLADGSDDLERAQVLAAGALTRAPGELRPVALVACGRVALARGDRTLARLRADEAVPAARTCGAVHALAEALELRAAATTAPIEARAALEEARAVWRAAGAQPATDRVALLLGRLPGADGVARSAGREAARRLQRNGVLLVEGLPVQDTERSAAVEVRVLGRFEVLVDGQQVPLPAWRSKQARTLVKVLVARRGRHVARPELCELLWPGDEPSRTAHRLSVLVSAVRAVLDPARAWPADRYVGADTSGLFLDLATVRVDTERLLQDASQAAGLLRRGDRRRAEEMLAEADASYRGDAFADEPYEDWAVGLREEVRAAWLRSLRSLAALRGDAGALDDEPSLLVRLLAADPYDVTAHRALVDVLVRTGRHGEARRAFARWARAMRDIGVEEPDARQLRRQAASAGAVLTRR